MSDHTIYNDDSTYLSENARSPTTRIHSYARHGGDVSVEQVPNMNIPIPTSSGITNTDLLMVQSSMHRLSPIPNVCDSEDDEDGEDENDDTNNEKDKNENNDEGDTNNEKEKTDQTDQNGQNDNDTKNIVTNALKLNEKDLKNNPDYQHRLAVLDAKIKTATIVTISTPDTIIDVCCCPLAKVPIKDFSSDACVSLGATRHGNLIQYNASSFINHVNQHHQWICPVTNAPLNQHEIDIVLRTSIIPITVSNKEFVAAWLACPLARPDVYTIDWMVVDTDKQIVFDLIISCIRDSLILVDQSTIDFYPNPEPLFMMFCWRPKMIPLEQACFDSTDLIVLIRTFIQTIKTTPSQCRPLICSLDELMNITQHNSALMTYCSCAKNVLALVPCANIAPLLMNHFDNNIQQQETNKQDVMCHMLLRFSVERQHGVATCPYFASVFRTITMSFTS